MFSISNERKKDQKTTHQFEKSTIDADLYQRFEIDNPDSIATHFDAVAELIYIHLHYYVRTFFFFDVITQNVNIQLSDSKNKKKTAVQLSHSKLSAF